ncbi:AraC family transcriptional regulator [Paenibacillus barcinonensis]|uniref:AraC family transcriptional regulator n=1 Tax=Paenibacillus barcinonensis TaxID=198119 RepID=A0A2V4V6T1_PAEBA|nr:AraC family transcriptional regulator [Paenibacillus barcinonensis]PYE44556.1 iron complex transport system substrate-binding protein [Paenibacillus barcinonensis]QKS58012.1 AraC family transcriptional regulator [Paenibacillus barcinonensis]
MEMLVDWDAHIEQWSHAAVRLQRIRAYREQGQGNGEVVGEQFDSQSGSEPEFTLNAHIGCFFVLTRGEVRIRMADEVYHCRSPYILHGGEGTGLSFDALDHHEMWDGYLVFYSAVPASSEERKSLALSYGFSPYALLPIQEKCEAMERLWAGGEPLDKLQGQSYFLPFVHEILRQRTQRLTHTERSRYNIVAEVIQYIQVHYSEPITVEKLAGRYDCSTSYLSRLFRNQMRLGPIEYLIHVRVQRARKLLLKSNAKVQDIASQVGYADVYYFSRLFKKYTGRSPLQFRTEHRKITHARVQNNPLHGLESSIVSTSVHSHNENESYYQCSQEGDTSMFQFPRPAFGAMMVLCTSLILSACQASTTPGGTNAQEPTSSTATTVVSDSTAAETRTYTHLKGQSEIPVHPQRVVSFFHLGELMALGVKPVGTTTYILDNPHISDKTGITDVGVPPDAEKILALEPDLIVTTAAFAEAVEGGYDALKQIAPTIVVEQNNDPVKDVEMFGDILGKQEEAEQWKANFTAKIAEYKEKIKPYVEANETFSILNVRPDALFVYGDTNMGGNILYKYLGLKPAAKVDSDVIHGDTWEISSEVIPEYIGDRLFLAVNKGAEDKLKDMQKLIDASPAGKSGQVYSIDFDQFLPSDAIAIEKQLDIITDLLMGKAQ